MNETLQTINAVGGIALAIGVVGAMVWLWPWEPK